MAKFLLSSSEGVSMGVYEADSPEGARDACARDAGYESAKHACEVLGDDTKLIATRLPTVYEAIAHEDVLCAFDKAIASCMEVV